MTQEENRELAEAIDDFASAIEAACVNLKRHLSEKYGGLEAHTTPPKKQQSLHYQFIGKIDYTKIQWENAVGKAGPYEKTTDEQNSEYQKLKTEVSKKGKFYDQGYFFWIFDDNKTICRKPTKNR